jgi:hypothetical protein
MRCSVVIDMYGLDSSLVVVLGLFVVLFLFARPVTLRVLVRPARRVGEWVTTHWKRTEELDSEELELWLVERRRRLCADLRRVEHLVATDTWMSATRQRGNRIAYNRLVDDLRHMPDVFTTIYQSEAFDPWHESPIDTRSIALVNNGAARQQPTVEILEIGWHRRRR